MTRPVYMQAQLANDWAKGIWCATWESTGGPQYFSGGKAPFVPEVRTETAGFTVNEGTITQLMLSYLAAGFKGFGFWAWNARTAGWEAGEFALLDRNNQPTPRAIRAGQIGQAAVRYRRELWAAHKEPLVGVLVDWENEAQWAAMAADGRDHFQSYPIRARIGISRALINANVPWEYVTAADLRAGLGPRYRVIYLPAVLGVTAELQQLLLRYVSEGGRLVLDLPGYYYDEFGRLIPTSPGSMFERTFGAVINEFGYARDINTPVKLGRVPLEGFTACITPTTARVVARYDNRQPAITEAAVGKGRAVIIGCQASLNCWRAGNAATERLIIRHTLGPYRSPCVCRGALVYRLAAPEADHYFLINDGPAKTVRLDSKAYRYRSVTDAVTEEKLKLGGPIKLEAYSGRWLRFVRARAAIPSHLA